MARLKKLRSYELATCRQVLTLGVCASPWHIDGHMRCANKTIDSLGPGNSNILYVRPEPWGFMIHFDWYLYCFKWVVEKINHQVDAGILEDTNLGCFKLVRMLVSLSSDPRWASATSLDPSGEAWQGALAALGGPFEGPPREGSSPMTRELQEVDDMVSVKIVFIIFGVFLFIFVIIVARCRNQHRKQFFVTTYVMPSPFSHLHTTVMSFCQKKTWNPAGQAEDVDGNGSEEIRSGFGSVEKDLGGYHHCPAALWDHERSQTQGFVLRWWENEGD